MRSPLGAIEHFLERHGACDGVDDGFLAPQRKVLVEEGAGNRNTADALLPWRVEERWDARAENLPHRGPGYGRQAAELRPGPRSGEDSSPHPALDRHEGCTDRSPG